MVNEGSIYQGLDDARLRMEDIAKVFILASSILVVLNALNSNIPTYKSAADLGQCILHIICRDWSLNVFLGDTMVASR